MFPGGMNPRQMKQMMGRMGIKTDEIPAKVVIISCEDKDIVIEGGEVMKMTMQGQVIYNITGGTIREQTASEEKEPVLEISDDDVRMVAEQAHVSPEDARKALAESKGDLAEAIMRLKG